jgi:competence protein ComEC
MALSATPGLPDGQRDGCRVAAHGQVTLAHQLGIAAVAGAATGVLTDVPALPGLAVVTLTCAVALLVWRRRLLPVVLSTVSCWLAADARGLTLAPLPDEWRTLGEPVWIEGVLTADAAPAASGVRLEVTSLGRRVRLTVGGTLATDPSAYAGWTRGATVRVPARVREPDVVRNPGSASARWQRLTRKSDAIGSVKSAALVEVQPAPWHERSAAAVRRHVRDAASRHLASAPADVRAIVVAILIGDRAGLDDGLARQLQAAGVFHVIAISGGNVAMLAAACLLCCRLLFRGVRRALLCTTLVVLTYGFIVGDDPSVARAVLAASLYFGVSALAIPPAALSLFTCVVVLNVLAAPLAVVDVGAWLSFGATFGLLVILPRIWHVVTEGRVPGSVWLRGLRAAVIGGVCATAAAEVVILPVSTSVFGRVGIAGLVLNLLAVPAMAVVQFGGMALCLADLVGAGTTAFATLTAAGVKGLLFTATIVESAPWLSWRVPASPLWVITAYFTAAVVAIVCRRPRHRQVAAAAATTLAAVMITAPWVAFSRPAAGVLRVSLLDVGQGDATVVQTPSGHTLLVDAGGSPSGAFDVGGRVVTPALWALGVRRLDWLLLTHGDLDHIGGAASILEDLDPAEVWEGIPVDDDPALQATRALAQQHGVAWRRLRRGHQVELDGVTIHVRHPPTPDWQRIRVRNDDSVVIEIVYGDVAILLTGDAGVEFEQAVTRGEVALARARLRVLKVGHHGSRSSTSAAFLDHWRPAAAIVSAGAHNLFGHPAPQVLDALSSRGVHVFRTDRNGAVIIESNGAQVQVRPMAGPRWTGR